MKTNKLNTEETTTKSTGCCTPTAIAKEQNAPCCEQPEDGSSCCDKTESKEVNSEKTGCC